MNATTLTRQESKGKIAGVEFFVFGTGDPVTVFAHGLAGSVSETKPLAMPLKGTRVLFNFRGHGGSDALRTAGTTTCSPTMCESSQTTSAPPERAAYHSAQEPSCVS